MNVVNAVFPPAEQAAAFFGGTEDGPFVMVNLLKFKERADYPEGSDAGLGTSIVQVLARHLNAKISLTDARPGTILSITRAENIAFANEPVMTYPAA